MLLDLNRIVKCMKFSFNTSVISLPFDSEAKRLDVLYFVIFDYNRHQSILG